MPKRTRSYDSWLLEKLTDPRIAANYINSASEDSEEMLLVALRNVAEAHKMTKVAEAADVNRESLYKALSSDGNPQLNTVRSVLDAVGLRIFVRPKVSRRIRRARIKRSGRPAARSGGALIKKRHSAKTSK